MPLVRRCETTREPRDAAQACRGADELTTRQISPSPGGSVYDPTDAVGRLLVNVLAMVAEFESDLIRLRAREGMKVAKAKGRLRGKQPKLNPPRRHTWSRWCTAASTALSRSPSSSVSAAPRCTGPSNGNASKREPASRRRHRNANPAKAPATPNSTPVRDAGASPCPRGFQRPS